MPPNECRISQPYGEVELATLTTGELGLPAPMHQMFRHYSQASQIWSRLNRPSMLDIIFFLYFAYFTQCQCYHLRGRIRLTGLTPFDVTLTLLYTLGERV